MLYERNTILWNFGNFFENSSDSRLDQARVETSDHNKPLLYKLWSHKAKSTVDYCNVNYSLNFNYVSKTRLKYLENDWDKTFIIIFDAKVLDDGLLKKYDKFSFVSLLKYIN